VRIMIESGRGSVSLLQRRLAIGYTRASRLVDQMSLAGILGDHKGSVAREVSITLEEWEQMREMEEAAAASGTILDHDGATVDDDLKFADPDGEDEELEDEVADEESELDDEEEVDDKADDDEDEYEYEYVDEDEEDDEYADEEEEKEEQEETPIIQTVKKRGAKRA